MLGGAGVAYQGLAEKESGLAGRLQAVNGHERRVILLSAVPLVLLLICTLL